MWLGGSLLATTKARRGPKCDSIGLAQEALVGVRHSSTLCWVAQRRMLLVLFPDLRFPSYRGDRDGRGS